MKILVYDTETTGLAPKNKFIDLSQTKYWPYVVQFSYIIYNSESKKTEKIVDSIIKIPVNILIDETTSSIHGITNKISLKKGISIKEKIDEFINDFE